MLSFYSDLLFFLVFFPHFGFEGRTLVLIASVPGNCFPCTFMITCVHLTYLQSQGAGLLRPLQPNLSKYSLFIDLLSLSDNILSLYIQKGNRKTAKCYAKNMNFSS